MPRTSGHRFSPAERSTPLDDLGVEPLSEAVPGVRTIRMRPETQGVSVPENRISEEDETLRYWAARCRQAYVTARQKLMLRSGSPDAEHFGLHPVPSWDGGRDDAGRTHQPVWPKMAKFLLANAVVPEIFMRAQVSGLRMPQPNQICNDVSLQRYHQMLRNEELCLDSQLVVELKAFQISVAGDRSRQPQLSDADLWRYALLNSALTVSPLFRYGVAVAERLRDVAEVFRLPAIEQFLQNPGGYQRHWAEVLPTGFADEVAAMVRLYQGRDNHG